MMKKTTICVSLVAGLMFALVSVSNAAITSDNWAQISSSNAYDGTSANWSAGDLKVGSGGTASLTIDGGSKVDSTWSVISADGGTGEVTITGEGSVWFGEEGLWLENAIGGTLNIFDNGTFKTDVLYNPVAIGVNSEILMKTGGQIAILGASTASLTAFLGSVQGTHDNLKYFTGSAWASMTAGTEGTDYTLTAGTGDLIGYGVLTVVISSEPAGFDLNPTPADSGLGESDLEVNPNDVSALAWKLPDGLDATTFSIQCWIEEYEVTSDVDGIYSFTDAELTGIVSDFDTDTASVPFAPEGLKEYVWKVVVDSDDDTLDASGVFTFKTSIGNDDDLVNAGDDSYTWLVDGTRAYVLDGTINDAFAPSSIEWTRTDTYLADDAVIRAGTQGLEDATVDITVGESRTYQFRLTVVNDGETYFDSVTVKVYDNGCISKINEDGYDVNAALARGDFNYNCQVDLDDLALLASNWLESSALNQRN